MCYGTPDWCGNEVRLVRLLLQTHTTPEHTLKSRNMRKMGKSNEVPPGQRRVSREQSITTPRRDDVTTASAQNQMATNASREKVAKILQLALDLSGTLENGKKERGSESVNKNKKGNESSEEM